MNTSKIRKRRAVSPIVATLILIIIAIVGAVSVGLIMSGIASSTSKAANPNLTNASAQLFVGSSSSAYPTISQLATSYDAANPGDPVVVYQSGSPQAIQSLVAGVTDIAVSSDLGTYQNALNQYPNANLLATEIGAGAEVVIEHGAGTGGFLTDGVNTCYGITQAALQKIFSQGTFSIATSACATYNTLDVTGVTTGTTYTAYVGPDEVAPQGSVAKYLAETPTGTPALSESALESAVQTNSGSIAFIEQGFNLNSGGNVVMAQPQIDTLSPTLYPSIYLNAGASAKDQQANLLAALTSSANTQWPDNAALTSGAAPGNLLTNHFQIVTSGTPGALAKEFIQYVESSNAESTFTSNGLFSAYQYNPLSAGTAPLILFSADSYVAESGTLESSFTQATSIATAPPVGAGSTALAANIRSGAPVSVFVSISKTATGTSTTSGLGGYSPGWDIAIAADQMVLAYTAASTPGSNAGVQAVLTAYSTASGATGTQANWNTFFQDLTCGTTCTGGTVLVGIANGDQDPAGARGWLVLSLADANFNTGANGGSTPDPTYCNPLSGTCTYSQSATTTGNWVPYYASQILANSGVVTAIHAAALIGPLQTGGPGTPNFLFMYKSLAVSAGLSYLALPWAVNLGCSPAITTNPAGCTASPSPSSNGLYFGTGVPYGNAVYYAPLNTKTGGSFIELYITVPTDSTNLGASDSFVAYIAANYYTLLSGYTGLARLTTPVCFYEPTDSASVVPSVISAEFTGSNACAATTAY